MSNAIKLKITLFACLLLLAVGGGILGQTGVEKTSSGSEKNSPASGNEVTSNSDPAEVVRKAYKNLKTVRSYRAHILSTLSGMNEVKFEFVAPDRHRTVNLINPERLPETLDLESIHVGGTTYIRRKGTPTKWEKSTGELAYHYNDQMIDFMFFEPLLENNSSIKAVGQETLDGRQTMVYQSLSSKTVQGGVKVNMTIKIWVGVRDNLPYKVEIKTLYSSRKSKSSTYESVNFYDYGADIKIEPPI